MELKATLKQPYTENERLDFIVEQNHNNGYEIKETETELQALGLDKEEQLQQYKQNKISENDRLRDEKLLEGVTYNNVLFDSDTDQKTNLLATYQMLSDEDTITWYGKDNKALLCTKRDLLAIGKLIVLLHSYCWNMNASIKEQIENAGTLEELLKIEVVY